MPDQEATFPKGQILVKSKIFAQYQINLVLDILIEKDLIFKMYLFCTKG
jgi:hypothetical protein